jgi:hypothetical protein
MLDNLISYLKLRLILWSNQVGSDSQIEQRHLFFKYQGMRDSKSQLPQFNDMGFRIFSQNDEDGLLLYIFSIIGMQDKFCVEVGFGSPMGANTTNFLCNWGWTGLLIDCDRRLINRTLKFFSKHPDTQIYPPKIICAWVTAENINDLIKEQGIQGEIDFFSIDLDGVDYWIWKSLDVIQPRVVCLEYQDIWGPEIAVTVPYQAGFKHPVDSYNYCGASLNAFVKLARRKGYRLIGCNRFGFNAFFIRHGIGEEYFPEISPEECFKHPFTKEGQIKRLSDAKKHKWIEV